MTIYIVAEKIVNNIKCKIMIKLCKIKNNLYSAEIKDINEIQDFIIFAWKEFFHNQTKEKIISKRKDLQKITKFYKNRNGNFWYLKKDNIIIATIAVHEILFKKKKVGFLRRFIVNKNYRNKGFGSEMLKFVENYAYQKNWEYLMFGIDKNMEKSKCFYFKNGYKEFYKNIPQEILDDNDAWYLKKKININTF